MWKMETLDGDWDPVFINKVTATTRTGSDTVLPTTSVRNYWTTMNSKSSLTLQKKM